MSKMIFNELQTKQLEKKENQQGKGPNQIFLENGFSLDIIGKGKPSIS
ncbi:MULTISPECIES: hypothetical protein [Bacillus cereus group]|uniref:Uncharacterized protein n=1 Tax=Bacillus cytotoxicus (strain DSM 22905 / CIP 110041 / 391-98 / NVH 391-98) TaxID=315749 RepID=A7GVB8_BACCN|nr:MULTISPECIES: hypothetical protein [Bacillus cereus group]ABS24076.1 conserved hypothetical protein [Bacillus cytotoxicus NVH 391-98]MDH2864778.1 hypothetical protein [Bacillus cytotoxicus]MDH2884634.1 hypothetical protein [Bacillus cytotoxicus]NZD33399.1 hypothetical protein [Bacillus cytotoxicus]SCN42805.1 Uncharacterized protein BC88300_04492 [Bacillus cytotoxicus]